MPRAKIVATIGPASSKPAVVKKLILSGVNVFRLNFSHGDHGEHERSIRSIRRIAETLKKPVTIIADLQGPKIRTGRLREKVVLLKRGNSIVLTTKKTLGGAERISIDYAQLPTVVSKGTIILLSEGMVRLRVISKQKDTISCRVLRGGVVGERKGVNIIGIKLASAFTAKDRADIRFALKEKVDYFALSFVRDALDVKKVKAYIARFKADVPIIAKIEKPEAVRVIRSILAEVSGVMVARGDLGVEGDLESVPIWQKKIIRLANKSGRFVITATQMLESMITLPMPTRAEVSDVANAIFDGTCAVMLSGETAIGKYPVAVIQTMRRIVIKAERSNLSHYYRDDFDAKNDTMTYSIAHAAIDAACEAKVKAIVVFTISGATATFLAKRRPNVPIFAFTPHETVFRRINIFWGVTPMRAPIGKDIDRVINTAAAQLIRMKHLKNGDRIVVVFGARDTSGGTDRMKIMQVGQE
jgi:pyruvate kinase